ncbi:MAG: substrate-binding domain-containing protein, partial [Pirellulaceae bacterium]|nr:substrate-binding domain-containing protein [Pirellulaceae bacterium]
MAGERDGNKNGWRLPHLGTEGWEIIERSIGEPLPNAKEENMKRSVKNMKRSVKRTLVIAAAVLVLLGSIVGTQSANAQEKYKFFYSASYYGNDWQAEATNMIKAMAAYYGDKIDLRVKVAGANAQRQIQQINAMIQAGANAIIVYPISPTALNKVAKAACDKGVVVISYDSEITEPCTYVAKVDAVDLGRTRAQ